MPSLSFKKEFAPGILAMLDKNYAKRTGVKPKTTTIRAKRKRPIKKGDRLFLFSGLRTKYCKKLGETDCMKVENISMTEVQPGRTMVVLDGTCLLEDEVQNIALADGFETWQQMIGWFRKNHGFPFEGQRIHMVNTYQRKYFCNKMVKDHGFALKLETTQKTILINQEDVAAAKKDRYIKELSTRHNYGVQILNPLFNQIL